MNGKYKLNRRKRDAIAGYLFILPALIAFVVFIGGPIIITFILSFQNYNILKGGEWIGLQNYKSFFSNKTSLEVLGNTFRLTIILILLHVVLALFLALLVYKEKRKGIKYFYRTAIYFPSVLTTASVAIAWFYMYNYDFGVFNWILGKLGLPGVRWLTSASAVTASICLFSIWKFVGTAFLYYLIGLQGIPENYYEAAEIDGANKFQIFFHITLPMLSPTMLFVITITTINSFQIFDEPYILTNGGPANSSRTIALLLYEKAFKSYEMGYASAAAIVLFVIVLIITLVLMLTQNKWVNYDVE